MRLPISLKLFLGFLVVIFLNVFFVVIVSKLTDLTKIANILKHQNEVKSLLLHVEALHGKQTDSYYIYDKLRRPESAENFRRLGVEIGTVMDSVTSRLESIRSIDSLVAPDIMTGQKGGDLTPLFRCASDTIRRANILYNTCFDNLLELESQWALPNYRDRARLAQELITAAADTLQRALTSSQKLIDDQNRQRISEIETRITGVRQITIIILAGMSLFAILFAFFFSRAITTTMRRLKESASIIAHGKFDFDPSGYPNDEVGDLARAFFDMAHDLKRVQGELVQSKRLAAIGEVVASVNHEINNPLMIISGNAQFIEMMLGDREPELRERVKAIIDETDRISRVTRKLREIKKPVTEDYTSSGEQMINLDKSSKS